MFAPLPALERVKSLVRLFRGRFNGGQARNDFNVRLALFLLLRLDFVRVGLDLVIVPPPFVVLSLPLPLVDFVQQLFVVAA